MTLPKRPPLGEPIPNSNIPNTPEQYIVKAPYWDAAVSGTLSVNEEGSLQIDGSSDPPIGEGEVLSSYWSMPLGNGLASYNGKIRTSAPQSPPYYCNTDVITSTISDFSEAWQGCSFGTFPSFIDTSSGTDFSSTWEDCTGLTSFPRLNFSNGEVFNSTWKGCSKLSNFPARAFDDCAGTDFTEAWKNCALNQASVNNILISLDTAGQEGGTVDLSGGTSSHPGNLGQLAKTSLENKGWTVTVNSAPTPGPNIPPGALFYFDAGNPECYSGTGTEVTDLGENGNNGTIFGPITFSEEGEGSFNFEEQENYEDYGGIYVPLGSLQGKTEFSYIAWVRATNSSGDYRTIIDFGNDDYSIFANGNSPGNDNEFIAYDPDYYSGVNLDQDQWYNVVYTFKYPGQAKLYVNGELVFEDTAEENSSTSDIYGVGAGFDPEQIPPSSVSEPWVGQIAMALVYDRELSGSEVGNFYDSTNNRFS